jgi:serine acetyltransferase
MIGAKQEMYAQHLTIYHGFTSGEERGAGSVRHPTIRSLNL